MAMADAADNANELNCFVWRDGDLEMISCDANPDPDSCKLQTSSPIHRGPLQLPAKFPVAQALSELTRGPWQHA